MNQRYGGKFSPDTPSTTTKPAPKNSFADKAPARGAARTNGLFLVASILPIRAFFQEPTQMATMLVAYLLIILAAWLTKQGTIAHQAYDARKIARRPALPRKIFGAALLGIGLGLVEITSGNILNALIFVALGTILHLLAFGPDPLKNKNVKGFDAFQTDRVARAVNEAEKHLQAMQVFAQESKDRSLITRIAQFSDTARTMFRSLENDPRDLSSARKYLGVYLLAARDATEKFVDVTKLASDQNARHEYLSLIDELEANFATKTDQFLENDKADLETEIDVLRARLGQDARQFEYASSRKES